MDINKLFEAEAILADANNIGIALSDKIQDLNDLASGGITEKNQGIVLYEVERSSAIYDVLINCMLDKIKESRKLFEDNIKSK